MKPCTPMSHASTRTEGLNFKVSYVCHFQLLGPCSNHCLQLQPCRQLTSEFWVLKIGRVLVQDNLNPCIPGRPQSQWMLRERHDFSLNLDMTVEKNITRRAGAAFCSSAKEGGLIFSRGLSTIEIEPCILGRTQRLLVGKRGRHDSSP